MWVMIAASQKVSRWGTWAAVVAVMGMFMSNAAWALGPLPFTENFSVNDSLWGTGQTPSGTRFPPAYSPNGGPNGAGDGFISYTKPFTVSSASTIFRCQDVFNSSGDAFVGNWQAANVTELSFYVKHDNPNPTTFFARIAVPVNFPAFSVPAATDVPTGVWTKVSLPVRFQDYTAPGSGWTFETFDDPEPPPAQNYAQVFGNVGNIQILAESEGASSVSFSLDAISIPEPASLGVIGLGVVAVATGRRRGGRA
jgi:hypothetical protein